MAPNQKSLAHISESLSNLDLSNLVKSEFLPLTNSKEQQTKVTPPSSDEYWSWTPCAQAEEAQETVSVSHMEEQLLLDAQRRSLKVETVRAVPDNGAVDYWDEACETDSFEESCTAKTAQHECYWDWTSDDAKDVFAVESIVDNLVCQYSSMSSSSEVVVPPSLADTAVPANYWDEATPKTVRATRSHASYWTWPSDAKQELIHEILKQAEAHRLCSARHVEANLVRQASDDYWQEASAAAAPDETMSDAYWNWESSSSSGAVPLTTSGAAPDEYWDW